MKKKAGAIIVCCILIFTFIVPIFYPYESDEVFLETKKSYVVFAGADIRSEYELYMIDSDIDISDEFSASVNLLIDRAETNKTEYFATDDGFLISKFADGIYTVEYDDRLIAVATLYGIDFYDDNVALTVAALAKDESYKAKLYLSSDISMQVYDENDVPVGRISNYIFRSDDGEDIFNVRQKDELKQIINDVFYIDDSLKNGEVSSEIYCDSLNENIKISKSNSYISVFHMEDRTLIDTYSSPSSSHLLGTDSNGMDVLSRLMHGGRISVLIGVLSALFCTAFGVLVGSIAGYFGKFSDILIMRTIDVMDCIPMFPVLVIAGCSMEIMSISQEVRCLVIIFIFIVSGYTGIAKTVRGQILYLKKDLSSIAAKSYGISIFRQIVFHMIPDTMPQIVSFTSMSICSFILAEASISFLGLGVQYPLSTWGSMINENSSLNELARHPAIWLSTVSMICLTAIGFYFIGDAVLEQVHTKGRAYGKSKSFFKDRIAINDKGNLSNCENIIEVKDLNIVFHNKTGDVKTVSNLSFSLKQGEAVAVLGNSGSGKTTVADSIMGLLPDNSSTSGSILVKTENGVINMLGCKEKERCYVRGLVIGYIMQEPLSCLNPIVKIGNQIEEVIKIKNSNISQTELKNKAYKLLIDVGFENDYKKIYSSYPAELSGGLCQRVMIAMAICLNPSIVIADEPCSSLDIYSKLSILKLLKSMMQKGTSIMLITHDVNEARFLTENIVRTDGTSESDLQPCENKMINDIHCSMKEYPEFIHVCDITKKFGEFKLKNISFDIGRGECLGIAGEIGCGKTTIANIVGGIISSDSGYMTVDGKKYNLCNTKNRCNTDVGIQMIFQNPYASLSRNMTCGEQIKEVVRANKIVSKSDEYRHVLEVMQMCGLSEEYYLRYPDSLSGGECQRVCIARAVALKPKLLICDEPLSSLDENLHARIIELLCDLKSKYGISILYITHEIGSLQYIADKVIFMSEKDKLIHAYNELLRYDGK